MPGQNTSNSPDPPAPGQSADSASADAVSAVPLVVDLDDTLVSSDTLHESLLKLTHDRGVIALCSAAGWLGRGKAEFKSHIAEQAIPDATLLPYHEGVLDQIREAKQAGRPIWLISAADQRIVDSVAEHLGLFDLAIGSTSTANLKGPAKLAKIEQLVDEHTGATAFEYIGDHRSDLPIWNSATISHGVFAGGTAPDWIDGIPMQTIHARPGGWRDALRAMRPHQWVKNTLVFLALCMSHQLDELSLWPPVLAAFFAFCLAASAVYLINDLLDIDSDRAHRTKRNRPIAAGRLSISRAFALAGGLAVMALALAAAVGPAMLGLIAIYMVATTLYSIDFKRRLLVDVITLAGLYTLRLVAGGVAIDVVVSPWLMAFCMFFFLGLALNKRYIELRAAETADTLRTAGRNYTPRDLPMVGTAGLASGYLSVLVFTLYISQSVHADRLYDNPGLLWLIAPLLVYWITRLWFIAHRGQLDDDPIVFALKDPVSWKTVVAVAAVLMLAS